MDRDLERMDIELVGLILDNIADGVFTVDRNFRITFFNPAAGRITGFQREEVLGHHCFEVFRTPICDRDCPLRQSIRQGRTIQDFEIRIINKEGRQLTIRVSTAPLIDQQGKFIGGVETFRDVTPIEDLRRRLDARYSFHHIVSRSDAMRGVLDALPEIAASPEPVLLQGRAGSGRELVAGALHQSRAGAQGSFEVMICNPLDESVQLAQLVGQVGARSESRQGKLRAAAGGTLYLAGAELLALPVQEHLLGIINEGKYRSLGASRFVALEARIILGIYGDPDALVRQRMLHQGLRERLSRMHLRLPDLCDRRADIPLLCEHHLRQLNMVMGRRITRVSPHALALLMNYSFPGNLRELRDVLEHAVIVCQGHEVVPDDLPSYIRHAGGDPDRRAGAHTEGAVPGAGAELRQLVESLERNYWNIPRAARELGIHRSTLWRKLRRLKIVPPTRTSPEIE